MKNKTLALVFTSFMFFTAFSQQTEDFSKANISSKYSNGSYLGTSGITWHYTNARGGQQTTKSKNEAISLNKSATASIYSDTIYKGITNLSFEWEQELTANCNASVFINNTCIGTLTSDKQADITQIFEAHIPNMPDTCIIAIKQNNASAGQITIDNITFTYAKQEIKPISLKAMHQNASSIVLEFSRAIESYEILSIPNNCILNYSLHNNQIQCNIDSTLYSNFAIQLISVCDTNKSCISDTTFQFYRAKNPKLHELIFTEIMPNPSDKYGLPNAEYIEIYNNTNSNISTQNCKLLANNKTYELPLKIIEPHSNILLISQNNSHLFTDTSKTIYMESFPILLNEGMNISLQCNNTLVTGFSYKTEDFNTDFKKQGWAIEKKDISNLSEMQNNWAYSTDYTGGTPYRANSIRQTNIDTILPTIERIEILNDTTLVITWNKNMPLVASKMLYFEDSTLQISSVRHQALQSHIIDLQYSMAPFSINKLIIPTTIHDFQGNYCKYNTHIIGKPDSLLHKNALIFNEILSNNSSTTEKFIEIYNTTNSFFDISKMYIANVHSVTKEIENIKQISNHQKLLPPHSYMVICEHCDAYIQSQECLDSALFVEIETLPSMPEQEGTIVLLNYWGEIIDSLNYTEKWHSHILSNYEDISLERNNNTQNVSWQSAETINKGNSAGCTNSNITSLQTEIFNTKNSNLITKSEEKNKIHIEYTITENSNRSMHVRIFDIQGNLVKHIINNELPACQGSIYWDGLGNNNILVSSGIYIMQIEILHNKKVETSKKIPCTVLN